MYVYLRNSLKWSKWSDFLVTSPELSPSNLCPLLHHIVLLKLPSFFMHYFTHFCSTCFTSGSKWSYSTARRLLSCCCQSLLERILPLNISNSFSLFLIHVVSYNQCHCRFKCMTFFKFDTIISELLPDADIVLLFIKESFSSITFSLSCASLDYNQIKTVLLDSSASFKLLLSKYVRKNFAAEYIKLFLALS